MANRLYIYAGQPGNPYSPPPEPAPGGPKPPEQGGPGGTAPTQVTDWNSYLNQGYNANQHPFQNQYRANRASDWFKTRGGHELYAMFKSIYDQNPMAGRAFWDSVVGRGQGQNDLMAATIHKMFGADMNAFNNWRNAPHYGGQEGQQGYFDLTSGQWKGGNNQSFNFQNWNPYSMVTGLQSTPGNAYAGAESWKTYGAGSNFDPARGAMFPGVEDQASMAAGTYQQPVVPTQVEKPQPKTEQYSNPQTPTPYQPTSNPYTPTQRNRSYAFRPSRGWNVA